MSASWVLTQNEGLGAPTLFSQSPLSLDCILSLLSDVPGIPELGAQLLTSPRNKSPQVCGGAVAALTVPILLALTSLSFTGQASGAVCLDPHLSWCLPLGTRGSVFPGLGWLLSVF